MTRPLLFARNDVRFLLSSQFESGAFPGGEIAEIQTVPSPFNSAQIIHGLLAWHLHAGDQGALNAALRAADWILSVQDVDGAFRRYSYTGAPSSYTAHASCWLAELGVHTGRKRYLEAAARHLDWVLRHYVVKVLGLNSAVSIRKSIPIVARQPTRLPTRFSVRFTCPSSWRELTASKRRETRHSRHSAVLSRKEEFLEP